MTDNPIKTISAFSSEEEYRAYPAIHYSQLASYFREDVFGLYKKTVQTFTMKFGNLVDTLCTRYDEMHNIYAVIPSNKLNSSEINLIEKIAASHSQENIKDVPRKDIIDAANLDDYRTTWKDDTRYNRIISEGSEYYRWYKKNSEKIFITQYELLSAEEVYNAIYNHPYIKKVLSLCKSDDYDIEFQVKLKDEEGYKCMLDAVFIDYKSKMLYPIDLKTTSDNECSFPKSLLKWQYWIQAHLYTDVLNNNLIEYNLNDWHVSNDFFFIVANINETNPMIFRFNTSPLGRYYFPKYSDIANEIKKYLSYPTRKIPFGMSNVSSNKIVNEDLIIQNPFAFTQWNRKHQKTIL